MIRLLLCCVLCLISASAEAGKTLIWNVNGYTIDPERRTLGRFGGLYIDEQGRVLATLARGAAEPRLAAGDFRLDARGRTLIPGLIDAHGHLMGLGLALRQLDLSAATSLADAQALVAQAASRQGAAAWVTGRGWNQERWGLGRFPTAAELDAAHAQRPVWLVRVDGHAGWANTAALRAAGIGRATPDPPGGRIERDPAGNPTGILIDTAMALVERLVPPPSPGEREQALEAALAHLASLGVTGMHDMGVSAADWALYRAFGDEGRLTLRITAYAAGMEAMEAIAPLRPTPWLYDDRLRLVGIKLFGDGALGSRGAWLLRPYADAPSVTGLRFHDDARLKNLFSRANYLGFQIAHHAIGSAANRQALDAFEEIAGAYGTNFRNRIEHAQVVDPADIPRFAALRVIASVQPIHAVSDRLMAEQRLDPAALEGAYAWASLKTAGAALALGSDTPVEPANPFLGLHAAVTRRDASGQPPGGWRRAQALDIVSALAGFTIDAAYAGHADRVGTLAPGKWADFLLLDRDPLRIDPDDLPNVRVLETWVGGRRVFVAPAAD